MQIGCTQKLLDYLKKEPMPVKCRQCNWNSAVVPPAGGISNDLARG